MECGKVHIRNEVIYIYGYEMSEVEVNFFPGNKCTTWRVATASVMRGASKHTRMYVAKNCHIVVGEGARRPPQHHRHISSVILFDQFIFSMNRNESSNQKRSHCSSSSSHEDRSSRTVKKVVLISSASGSAGLSVRRAVGVAATANLLTLSTTATVDASLDAKSATVQAAHSAITLSDPVSLHATPSSKSGPSSSAGIPNHRNRSVSAGNIAGPSTSGPSQSDGPSNSVVAGAGTPVRFPIQDPWSNDRAAPYARPHWWVDVYEVLTYRKWPVGLPWAIGGAA